MDSVDQVIRSTQSRTFAPVNIPDNSDFQGLPEGVLSPEIKIPATDFVPEIIIPEIRIN